jgi:hypothetical protein
VRKHFALDKVGIFSYFLFGIYVPIYQYTKLKETRAMKNESAAQAPAPGENLVIERIQTGVRLEKRLLKVLKGLAEYHDLTLGDLLEGIVLHAFEGKCPFGEESLRRIADLKRIYNLNLDATASHRLIERERPAMGTKNAKGKKKKKK